MRLSCETNTMIIFLGRDDHGPRVVMLKQAVGPVGLEPTTYGFQDGTVIDCRRLSSHAQIPVAQQAMS